MNTLGLDIGGANIKAAHSDGRAWSRAFALWKNPKELGHELAAIALEVGSFDQLAVTMTAELCDCFAIKREGVNRVLDAVTQIAAGRAVHVWQTDGRFVLASAARDEPGLCAAANWHALGTHMAGCYSDGLSLMVDTGSTTTDIIGLFEGKVDAVGVTDRQRLATGELIYVGARRTALMALGPKVMFHGRAHRIMAEYFATMGDVHLMLGDLHEDEKDCDTPDGRGMSQRWASARIARMIGADLESMSFDDVIALAQGFSDNARQQLVDGIAQVTSHHQSLGRTPTRVILSGSGDFLAATAVDLTLPGVEVVRWSDRVGPEAASAACAHALVQLFDQS